MVGAVEMVQRVKVIVTKSDNLRSFPRIHRGRSPTLQLYSDLLLWVTYAHTTIQIGTYVKTIQIIYL